MEVILFMIGYTLTLKDGTFMSTKTPVAATNREIAVIKLEMWLKSQKLEFDKIELNSVGRDYALNIII